LLNRPISVNSGDSIQHNRFHDNPPFGIFSIPISCSNYIRCQNEIQPLFLDVLHLR
jgi:hypothetical protein